MSEAGKRLTPRRAVELVAVTPDRRGKAELCIAVTVSLPGQGMKRKTFPHDETPESLADALAAASEWVRARAPSQSSLEPSL